MNSRHWLANLWLAAFVGSFVFGACARLNPPDEFVCGTNADCATDEHCVADVCHPESYCVSSSDCDSGHFCSPSKTCVEGCEADRHCEASERCRSNSCVIPECLSNEACGERQICEGEVCVDVDCVVHEHCQAGVCVNNVCLPDRCIDDSDCPGRHCAPSSAGDFGTCVECLADEECAPYACDVHTCHTSCIDDSACAVGYECIGEECLAECGTPCAELGQGCDEDRLCAEGSCCWTEASVSGVCSESCEPLGETGAACAAGGYCASGICVNNTCRLADGEPCDSGLDCASAECCLSVAGGSCGGCPALIGDACNDSGEASLTCATGQCEGQGSWDLTGFCSKGCAVDSDCGVDSRGVQNACVVRTSVDGTLGACNPRCTVSLECEAIDAGLDCYTVSDRLIRVCAYNPGTWGY